jgi:micrococcal nuclease
MKKFVMFAVSMFVCGVAVAGPRKPYRLNYCHDGDTCRVTRSETELNCRLLGIDAPEVKGPKWPAQDLSMESGDFLTDALEGWDIQVTTYGKDRYGRSLCTFKTEAGNINLLMLQAGMAEVYRGADIPKGFDNAEVEAKAKQAGIWGLPNYESPAAYRKRHK